MNDLNEIDCCFSTLNENKSIDLVLHDSDKFKGKKKNKKIKKKKKKKKKDILISTIKFIKDCKRFDEHQL